MILFKIILKRICKASAFFFNKLCPFCAPFSLLFINIWALKQIYIGVTPIKINKKMYLIFNIINPLNGCSTYVEVNLPSRWENQ